MLRDKKQLLIYLFIIVCLIIFFLQNRAVPFFSDDIGWIGSITHSDLLGTIKEFFSDQTNVWLTQNGRAVNHAVWQLTICGGELCYDIFISIVFLGTILLLSNLVLTGKGRESFAPWTMIVFTFLYLSPDHATNFYWAGGGCHYLWPYFLTLIYLSLLKRSIRVNLEWYIYVPSLLFCFLAGWTHEIFSLPVSFALLCTLLFFAINGKIKEINIQQISFVLLYCLGALMIVISPGTITRIGGTMGSADVSMIHALAAKLVTSFKIFRYGRCFYLLLILFLYISFSKKESLRSFINKNAFLLLSFIGSLGIVVILGVGGRAVWGVEVFSLMIILKWINEKVENNKYNYNLIACIAAIIIVIHQSLLIMPFHDSWSTYKEMDAQTKQPGFQGTARMVDWQSGNVLIDPYVAHPYEMMMQDIWMRAPLHCNVCKSDVYDFLLEKGSQIDSVNVTKIHGDFIIPYSDDVITSIETNRMNIDLEPISFSMDGGFLFITWHSVLQKLWSARYPTNIDFIFPEEYSILNVGDSRYIRFEKPIRPIAREIKTVELIR